MDDFLLEFFPAVYAKKQRVKEDNYCKYDNQFVQLFTSSLYLAALVSSFLASKVCSKYGAKLTIFIASIFYWIGADLNAAAINLTMLIIGRIILGVGVGFGNEAFPLLLYEIAPVNCRGPINIVFQLFVTIGIFCANMVNYFVSNIHPMGWRLALGLDVVPATILFFGSFVIPETPTSFIKLGELQKGRTQLENIRGTEDVDAEFNQLVVACQLAHQVKNPFKKLTKPTSQPPLIIAILLQVFQQFTGINALIFYSPVLFQTVGFKDDASLLLSVIIGIVNVISTLVSIKTVIKFSRRVLLLQACWQMFITQSVIGGILFAHLNGTNSLGRGEAIAVVLLVCLYVLSFAWSWGPLGWSIPVETFPLETRTVGYAFAARTNMLFTFIIAHTFLSMMCHMRAGIFFFFAAWILVMGIFVLFLLPETKDISIDEMGEIVWKQHWFWKRYMVDDDDKNSYEKQIDDRQAV
ncbi:Sugar/inositol transporter [Macleaya cordata]|uniref:Sugar/inositol transporter n=1 Tax=Macleaya cordata TaxID=56857 RepID=A0A200Q5M3_MACCD|nr:Sugar/inositol transporter [Macleaya cordata]